MSSSFDNVNPLCIARAFVNLVESDYPDYTTNEKDPSELEKLIAKKLISRLNEIFSEYSCEDDEEMYSSETAVEEPLSQGFVDDEEVIMPEPGDISISKKAKILKMIDEHPNWKLSTIQNRGGASYKYKSYKRKWEAQVKQGGSIFEIYGEIDKYTFANFQEARSTNKIIRSTHIKRWGIQKYLTYTDPGFQFKASDSWVKCFKKRHNLSSRKVVRLVSRSEILDSAKIIEAAKKFQSEFKALLGEYRPEYLLNTDQTAFQYELIPKRTITQKGEKIVTGLAESPKNRATHTHTVQYTISAAGDIIGDAFLCLQEKNGQMGATVENGIFLAPNITLTCSKSGKLSTSSYEYYLDKIIIKNMSSDFVLTVDSWPGQINPSSYQSRFGTINDRPNCEVKIIPEKCTAVCQPLDTTFHMQLKYLAKEMCAHFAVFEATDEMRPEDKITTRNNVIRLQSILHHQFSAPIFKPMVKYCFVSAGLIDDKVEFLNTKQVCFTFDSDDPYICIIGKKCSNQRFLKCSWCRKVLCFQCLFFEYHTVHCEESNLKWNLLKS